MTKIINFDPQNLSNTAWAFATLGVYDKPLFDAIAAAAIRMLAEFDMQSLANMAFAFATLYLSHHGPLLSEACAACAESDDVRILGTLDAQPL